MASEYTGSPLGLVPNNAFTYDGKSSIFSSKNFLRNPGQSKKGLSTHPLQLGNISDTHSDEVYNTGTQNIIDKLNDYPSMRLKWADFAYCKDFGVYPNNRLVICRRFPAPVTDDLTFNGATKDYTEPVSTLISWFDDQKNVLEFTVGENWDDADGSFKSLLNDVGKEIGMKSSNFQLGDILYSGLNIVPLPGATEGLQRKIMAKLGLIGDNETADLIPSGTPNLIKEAKKRPVIKDAATGSGLKGKLLDSRLQDFLKPGGASRLVKDVVQAFADTVQEFGDKLKKVIREFFDSSSSGSDASLSEEEQKKQAELADQENEKTINQAISGTLGILKSFANTVIKKYRVQALGIVTALTGIPATPWHVTIGNPLRPIFSSGDMLCEEVTINLGPQLAFNDLPSTIEAEFKLVSQRNLGIDEVMEKLSCGAVRITVEQPTFWNQLEGDGVVNESNEGKNTEQPQGPTASPPVNNEVKEEDAPVVATQSSAEQSKVGNEPSTGTASTTGQTVNPDPNSNEPILGKTELPTSTDEEYTVKRGDTIWGIAKKKLGPNATDAEVNAKMKDIIAKNKNKNPAEADGIVKAGQNSDPDFIVPGEKLIV